MDRQRWRRVVCGSFLCVALPVGGAQEQYPKPLIHTPANHPADRVILLVVDGLNAIDLALWVQTHPGSALSELSRRGVSFTNAHVPWPDEAAGLVALVTGGTPVSTGIASADGYDRALSPRGSQCKTKGAALPLDERLEDKDGKLDPAKMPLNPDRGCSPIFPHDLLRVNTIFEVMKERGGRTAWAGRNAALTDLYEGPSGSGLSEACVPAPGDAPRMAALLHWVDGKDCGGHAGAAVPVVMGVQLSAVGQAKMGAAYADATGTPAAGLTKALEEVDSGVGSLVRELKTSKLFDTAWIVVTSGYGKAPSVQRAVRSVDLREVQKTGPRDAVAHVSASGSGMVWLKDASATSAIVKSFSDHADSLGIEGIDTSAQLGLAANMPSGDSRMPDLILRLGDDVRWTPSSRGSAGDEDAHVALLVSGTQLTGRVDKTTVPTTQLAPLLLRALGMEKFDLRALHQEHSPALPGIF